MTNRKRRHLQHSSQESSRKQLERTASSLPIWKKCLFASFVTLLFFGGLEAMLAISGQRPQSDTEDPFVGFAAKLPLFVPAPARTRMTPASNPRLYTANNKLAWFNAQDFRRVKSNGTYRIFCLGGSTTYGRPYSDATSFCGWMREFLTAADPTRDCEVINAGGISYASYRVAMVLEEILQYSPDLIVIYTGHNEFLEERTYAHLRKTPRVVRKLGVVVSRTRTYALVNRIAASALGQDRTPKASKHLLPAEVETRLDKGVGPDAFHRDDALQAMVLEQFSFNLNRIVDLATSHGTKVMLVTPAANLKSCSPFKSEVDGSLSSQQQQHVHALLAEARQHFEEERWAPARTAVQQALDVDARCAEAHYLHGQILERLHDLPAAKAAYVLARDHDVCPLRAVSAIPQIVRQTAKSTRVPLVDFEQIADQLAEQLSDSIVGDNLFLDHVHPTIEGHRQLSLAIIQKMIETNIVSAPANWNQATQQRVTKRVLGSVDRQANGDAMRNLAKVFAWAGKQDEANRMALQADELLSNDANATYLAANALIEQGKFSAAIAKLTQAIQMNPQHALSYCSLGVAYQKQGNLADATQQYLLALQVEPDNAVAHNNLGALFVEQQRWSDAVRHLKRAVELNPHYAKGFQNLAAAFAKQGQTANAIETLQRVVEIDANFLQAHADLAKLWLAQKQTSQAIVHLRRVLQIDPQRYMTANQLSRLLSTSRDESVLDGKEAVRWALHGAEGTQYKNPALFDTLAAAYAESGDFEQAVEWQSKVLALAPEHIKPRFQERLDLYRAKRPYRE